MTSLHIHMGMMYCKKTRQEGKNQCVMLLFYSILSHDNHIVYYVTY